VRLPALHQPPQHVPYAVGDQRRPLASSGRYSARAAPGVPQAGEEETSVEHEAAARKGPEEEEDAVSGLGEELLRRTFDFDVFACVRCGGRRRVLAYVKEAAGVRAIVEHLGLPTAGARLAPARQPPQSAWC
jgi:hypothetical protein